MKKMISYEAPVAEVIEMNLKATVLTGSGSEPGPGPGPDDPEPWGGSPLIPGYKV